MYRPTYVPENTIFSPEIRTNRKKGSKIIRQTLAPPPTPSATTSEESVGVEEWGWREDPEEWISDCPSSESLLFENTNSTDDIEPSSRPKVLTMQREKKGNVETIFVLNADLNPNKTEHFKYIFQAMEDSISYIVLEKDRTNIDRRINTWIRLGRHFFHTFLASGYWTTFAVYFWPHLKWTWIPSFLVASASFAGYQLFWYQDPTFKYQPCRKDEIAGLLPKNQFQAGMGILFKMDKYRHIRLWHSRLVYGWILYNFMYYTIWPYPPTVCDWRCIEMIPELSQKY